MRGLGKIVRGASLALALLALGGCSVSKLVDAVELPSLPSLGSGGEDRQAADTDRMDTIAFGDAYCRGDMAAALASAQTLLTANPQNPKAHLLEGLALDASGRGIEAYRALDVLAAADHRATVSLRCGEKFVYSGSVSEVAQRRLFEVKTKLIALGAMLPLPEPAAAAPASQVLFNLASQAPAHDPFARLKTAQSEAKPAMAPSHDPAPAEPEKGATKKASKTAKADSVFVHLGSYRSMKMLDKGWKDLSRRYDNVLHGRTRVVSKVDLGSKGKYIRLGVAVASKGQGADVCRQLKTAGQYCAVIATGKS
jgi:hypothetical protein